MQVLIHDIYGREPITILPIFDVHVGPEACDEEALKDNLAAVALDNRSYLIGGGDYCDYILKSDSRFDIGTLAPWMIDKGALSDPARFQTERIIDYFQPVAGKFLGLASGNHEGSIYKKYERDVLGEICRGIGRPELALGYEGWIVLRFYATERSSKPDAVVRLRVHHGFGGGKSEGAPMVALSNFMLTNAADLTLMGHIHRRAIANPVLVEYLDDKGNPQYQVRKGTYCGTYLRTRMVGASTYSAISGYAPTLATGSPLITINPWARIPTDRVLIAG